MIFPVVANELAMGLIIWESLDRIDCMSNFRTLSEALQVLRRSSVRHSSGTRCAVFVTARPLEVCLESNTGALCSFALVSYSGLYFLHEFKHHDKFPKSGVVRLHSPQKSARS